MRRIWTTAFVSLGLVLSACATPTPYQPLKKSGLQAGGYSDLKIASDRYRISFTGNGATNRDTVERYLLYHAAELTLQQGYDWFILTNRRTDQRTNAVYGPDYAAWQPEWFYYGRGRWLAGPYSPFGPPWDYGETASIEYRADAELLFGHGPKPANNPAAFDARDVQANLGPTIQLPKPKA